jgi:hypothetical protein
MTWKKVRTPLGGQAPTATPRPTRGTSQRDTPPPALLPGAVMLPPKIHNATGPPCLISIELTYVTSRLK